MIAWCLGGLLAALVFSASSLLIFFKLLIFPRLLPKLPELILPEPVWKCKGHHLFLVSHRLNGILAKRRLLVISSRQNG